MVRQAISTQCICNNISYKYTKCSNEKLKGFKKKNYIHFIRYTSKLKATEKFKVKEWKLYTMQTPTKEKLAYLINMRQI